MILELPFSADPAQAFTVQLGEVKATIEARYNSRSGVWSMDISDDASLTPYALGLPIVLGVDLLGAYNLGLGSIVAIDKTNQNRDAGPDDLGSRVAVYWISGNEDFA